MLNLPVSLENSFVGLVFILLSCLIFIYSNVSDETSALIACVPGFRELGVLGRRSLAGTLHSTDFFPRMILSAYF